MNDTERLLLRAVCDGNIRNAQKQARVFLSQNSTKKDASFVRSMLGLLDTRQSTLMELPHNLKELLTAEDVSSFPTGRFIRREGEMRVVDKMLATLKAAGKLSDMGIGYTPTLLLHGESGGGKTMLARYLAYRAERPFVYVRFSGLVSSYLGSTQSNITKVFEYARTAPCVLCFDEIDAVGMARGQKNDVGEMNRIVIALMQELDTLANDVIVIGTTNRFDRLDDALIRRFRTKHEVLLLTKTESFELADLFFRNAGYESEGWRLDWCEAAFGDNCSAADVVDKCTEKLVSILVEQDTPEAVL